MTEAKLYTVKQMAEKFGVHPATITRLLVKDKIHGVKPMGGHWRVTQEEVDRIEKVGVTHAKA